VNDIGTMTSFKPSLKSSRSGTHLCLVLDSSRNTCLRRTCSHLDPIRKVQPLWK